MREVPVQVSDSGDNPLVPCIFNANSLADLMTAARMLGVDAGDVWHKSTLSSGVMSILASQSENLGEVALAGMRDRVAQAVAPLVI
eukprot:3933504-Amphidinium_carterae.1